jgi:hypothetical protein
MTSPAQKTIDTIKCPSCGKPIPITQTLRQQIAEEAKADLQHELTEQRQELALKTKELQTKEAKLRDSEKEITSRVAAGVMAEKAKLAKEALNSARSEVSVHLQDLESRASENEQKLKAAEKKELQLLKEKRELEAAKQTLELDVARRLEGERNKIREAALKDAAEQHRLKDAEKDLVLQQIQKANEEMRRKLEQRSQQMQGEVLELELDQMLRDRCPLDEILEVPKGVRGADVLQKVNSRSGLCCGLIIWEAKNTKNWSEAWVGRLKDNQRQAKADVAVLVSEVVPEDVDSFGFRDGVWVTKPKYVPALVLALRHTLTEVAQAKRAVASKNENIEVLFNYMTGPEFRHRVEAIAGTFIEMRDDLEKEKRTINKHWAKRAKQLDVIIVNTSGMYGDLQGLGAPIKPIPALESGDSEEVVQLVSGSEDEDPS